MSVFGVIAEMNNVRRNKDPEQDLNVSYEKYIKPFTTVNTENIYLDNAYIQQVGLFVHVHRSHHRRPFSSSTAGLLR